MAKTYISKIANGSDVAYIKDTEARQAMVTSVSYDTTNKKITQTINGTTSDVVTAAKLATDGITRNVTGAAAWTAADVITTTNANSGNVIKASGKTITTTAPSSTSGDTTVPTSKAVYTAISNGMATADALVYKGVISGSSSSAYGTLTVAADKGHVYKVDTAGKIDGITVEVGDMIICNTDGTAAATSSNYTTIAANWDVIQGNISGLGNLAFKNSATGTITTGGSNAASSVTLTGGSTSKLVTTSITGTNGTESVSAVSKTSKKLTTTSITGTNGTLTTHDTPTLNTSSIGSASDWNAGTMFSSSYDSSTETLTLNAGSAPSLTITSTNVGTSLTAGAAQTVAKVASSATTVATGGLSDTSATSNVGSEIVSAVSITNKTVAKAASSATTVATGSVASDGGGATVATALRSGGTAAAQTFTGSSVSVTVS